MCAQNVITVNEFLGHSWNKTVVNSNVSLGVVVLESRGFFTEAYWYWLQVGAMVGFVVLFNLTYTAALAYLNRFDKSQAVKHKILKVMRVCKPCSQNHKIMEMFGGEVSHPVSPLIEQKSLSMLTKL